MAATVTDPRVFQVNVSTNLLTTSTIKGTSQINLIKDRLTRPYTHTSVAPWIYWDSTKKAHCYIFRV